MPPRCGTGCPLSLAAVPRSPPPDAVEASSPRGAQSLRTAPGSSFVSVCQRSIFLSLFFRQSNQCFSLSPLALIPSTTPPGERQRGEVGGHLPARHTRTHWGTPGHAGHPTPKEEFGSERGSRDRGQCHLAKISGTRPALPDAPLTYEVIRFPDVVVPHGDFQGLFGQVAVLYLIAELLWGEQEPSG